MSGCIWGPAGRQRVRVVSVWCRYYKSAMDLFPLMTDDQFPEQCAHLQHGCSALETTLKSTTLFNMQY